MNPDINININMKNNKRFIVTAGGTGGHIYPALAIAEELLSRDCLVLFVGNKQSMEERVVSETNIPFSCINVQKLYRSLTVRHFLFPVKLLKSIIISGKIIKQFKPTAVIGAGGFVSAPVIMKAVLSGIPIYIQEQNSAAGLTNKLLSSYAKRVFLGFDITKADVSKKNKYLYTGNPLRHNILTDTANKTKKNRLTLLIIGGSQGAKVINDAVLELLPELLSGSDKRFIDIYWQCGDNNYLSVKERLHSLKWLHSPEPEIRYIDNNSTTLIKELSNVKQHCIALFPFTNNMISLYREADIAISRAGAISLAELEVNAIPSIIIPIPKSAGNHQYLNAKEQENAGKGIVIEQLNLNNVSLMKAIKDITDNLDNYLTRLRLSKHKTAVSEIVNTILGDFDSHQEKKKD